MAKKTVLKSTGEEVQPIGVYGKSSLNAPVGYSDVLIPRKGMKNGHKAAIERVRDDSLIQKKI